MNRSLYFTREAEKNLEKLRNNQKQKGVYKQVLKTLGLMEVNLKHPSLNIHKYKSLVGLNSEDVWAAYAQNKTPGAYRVFFHYGCKKTKEPALTIIAITPHP